MVVQAVCLVEVGDVELVLLACVQSDNRCLLPEQEANAQLKALKKVGIFAALLGA